jgi:hypothetical protein
MDPSKQLKPDASKDKSHEVQKEQFMKIFNKDKKWEKYGMK